MLIGLRTPGSCLLFVGAILLMSGGCDSSRSGSDPSTSSGASSGTARTTSGGQEVNTTLSGKVEVDGSSTVYPICEAAAAEFNKIYPNVKPTVGKSGTGGGFKRFTVGETDFSNASRPLKGDEFEACRNNGVAFIELPIAYDGLTIVVNPKNTFCNSLTIEQIKEMFLDGTGVTTWKDVNESWPAEKIKFFAPGTDSGTFDYFKEVIAGKDNSIRGDMSTSEEDNVLVNGVAGDQWAIGFFGVAYFEENRDKLRAVPVVNPDKGEPVMPTPENIENGSYAPFSRPLMIYLNAESAKKPQVEEFARYFLENSADFAARTGYVPLPQSVYDQAMENFESGATGTHWLDDSMEKREGSIVEVFVPDNLVR